MPLKRKFSFLIIWLIFIIYASLSPAKTIPKLTLPHFDKLVHFCMYFGLAFLLIPITIQSKKLLKTYALALAIAAATGFVFEVLQYFMANGRTASIFDELANTVGALSGIAFYHLAFRNTKLEKLIFKIE